MRFDVVVVGAGALGLAVAATLQRRGRTVAVLAPDGPTASAQAAGMLAPAFESGLERLAPADAQLLRRARDLWPAFARSHDLNLFRDGAEWRGRDPEALRDRLRALGFKADLRGAVMITPDDWRIDPWQAMAALRSGLERLSARLVRLEQGGGGWQLITDGGRDLTARQVVLASGWRDPNCGIVLPALTPVRGQAVRVRGWSPRRVIRGEGVYVVPQTDGAIVGATMEVGRTDTAPEAATTEQLLLKAQALCPELGEAEIERVHVGVRGASPDGWPYAGLLRPGLAVALAPRRNGWLLAPMMAGLVAEALQGTDPDPSLDRMNPGRVV